MGSFEGENTKIFSRFVFERSGNMLSPRMKSTRTASSSLVCRSQKWNEPGLGHNEVRIG